MQLFDFRCQQCDHVFEDWDNSDGDAKPICPECSSPDTKRLISSLRIDYTGMATSGRASSDANTTAIDKWHKTRTQQLKIEQRNLERHGTER